LKISNPLPLMMLSDPLNWINTNSIWQDLAVPAAGTSQGGYHRRAALARWRIERYQ
jgi:hypothetical protein